ncbi:molybdopterin-synthase adenylyltransferase MoeB [Candidatus Woesearchaeota archaeon]|nr:molybdopterin-synthase adenylyltransferase MoeB [Candidatus Woesearchaeota archaeon]
MNEGKLSKEEQIRYSRHLALPEIGIEGQKKLKKAKVLIVGAGGLGSPAAVYLAAAGVGKIGIVDYDKVDLSNLQRQILYSLGDIGKSKTAIIKNQLKKINPNAKIITHDKKLTSNNVMEIIKDYNVIIDGSDNFPTRYLVNDACVLLNKPDVYGSVYRFDGQVSVFNYENGPCYRCLFPSPPPANLVPNCAEAGVLGVLPGVIGMIQATEAIKIILGKGETLSGRLLVYNALSMKFRELNLKKNKNCPVCSENAAIKELIDYDEFCNGKKEDKNEITVHELKQMINNKEDFVLVDTREKAEQDMCKIENAKLASFSEIARGNLKIFDNIGKNKKIVLYCHTGNRSAFVMHMLKKKGYKNVKNLVGGIDAWAKEIDQQVPIY